MQKKRTTKQWEKYFLDRGVSKDIILIYLDYIKVLNNNNVPIIFEFHHLSSLLGIQIRNLASMIMSSESYYRSFYIPKRKGGKRLITSPYPSLLHCQKWIYKNILLTQTIHPSAHGFAKKKSIITNASEHLSSKCLLKMDLKNFFPSIGINWIINLFQSLGYAKNVSFYLASLCCHNQVLSQGSATSPYLTNILLKHLDRRLCALSSTYNLKYTRYADDFTFSGNYIPHKFIAYVSDIVSNFGLRVNGSKTALHTKPGQRIVTGLSVSGPELSIPRKTKRNIKKEIYYIKKYGFLSHAGKMKIRNPFYLESLKGKLNFWHQVEPENIFVIESIEVIKQEIKLFS